MDRPRASTRDSGAAGGIGQRETPGTAYRFSILVLMNRRSFSKQIAGGALGLTALKVAPAANEVPYSLSVMLWTVFTNLPIEQRFEKVVEAGFKNIELIGEDDSKAWVNVVL